MLDGCSVHVYCVIPVSSVDWHPSTSVTTQGNATITFAPLASGARFVPVYDVCSNEAIQQYLTLRHIHIFIGKRRSIFVICHIYTESVQTNTVQT